jgi:ribose-phosphate pyrophosphokinase
VNIIGDVKGREAVLLDDIVDTAGTLAEVSRVLMEAGAKKVWAVATHGVLSGPAADRIQKSPLERLIVTDTVPIGDKATLCPKIEVLTVSELLGEAIQRIHRQDSVSSLFV